MIRALVAATVMQTGARPTCFTVGLADAHEACELDEAAQTAEALGLPYVRIEVRAEDLRQQMTRVVGVLEEPLGTPSVLLMDPLVQRAREDVTVVLSGQGSDELWGGYRRYQSEVLRGRLGALAATARLLSPFANSRRCPEALERLIRSLPVSDEQQRHLEARLLFTRTERRRLLKHQPVGGFC